LDDLVDAHLLTEPSPERYRQHDLVREHARALAAVEETPDDRRAALRGLLDHYLSTASSAVDVAYPDVSALRPRRRFPQVPFDDSAQALAWLDAECANLLAIGRFVAERDWPESTVDLSTVLYPYLDAHALHAEALELSTHALAVSQRLGSGEAQALLDCVTMNWRQGRYENAEELCLQALTMTRESGDSYGEARALNGLANVLHGRRDYGQAREAFLAALELFRANGDKLYEAIVLGNLGLIPHRDDRATEYLEQALAINRDIGSLGGQGTALTNLALLHTHRGEYDRALKHLREALELYREIGYASGEADILNGFGTVATATGAADQAIADHTAALDIATEVGNHKECARAHDGLARAYQTLGQFGPAREQAERARNLYEQLGLMEAKEADKLLAELALL
jgi:tetratricopeptide (TPR) repeat protein